MSYFNVEGFLFWLLIGEFFAMLLKAMFHRWKRWIQSVRYKTKLAGGTLLVDIEADYWNKKIHDPMYRPIWRWYYGTLWNKAHPAGTQAVKRQKRRLVKLAALVSAILLICIGLVAAFGVPSIVPAPVPVTTKLEVNGEGNLSLVSYSNTLGWVYDLNGTARPDGNYSGGEAGLGLGLKRTDKSNADATVFFNVTSGTFVDAMNGNVTTTYVYRVTYLIFDFVAQTVIQYDVYNSGGGDTQFGYLLTVPAHSTLQFNMFVFFRAFNSTYYTRYITIQPAFSDYGSVVGIDGGYIHLESRCVTANAFVVTTRC